MLADSPSDYTLDLAVKMLRSPTSRSFLQTSENSQGTSHPEMMEIVEELPEAIESASSLQEVELADILQAPSFLASHSKSRPGPKDRSSTVHSSTKASSGLQAS